MGDMSTVLTLCGQDKMDAILQISLIQIMAGSQIGNKSLYEPMIVQSTDVYQLKETVL